MIKVIRYSLCLMVCAIFLSGCASQAKYKKIVQSWVGHSERDLILSWGVPAATHDLSDTEKLLVYRKSGSVALPGLSPTYTTSIYGNTAYTTSHGGTSPSRINFFCETTFHIINERIANWKYKGNNCVAK